MLMMKGAKKIVENLAGVQPDEKVIIVTNMRTFNIAQCVSIAAYQITDEVFFIVIPPLKKVGSQAKIMPELILSIMSKADVIFSITNDSTTRSIRAAIKKSRGKARGISMAHWTEEMLYKGGIEADFDKIRETTHEKILEIFKKAKTGEVITDAGTHLKVDLIPRSPDYKGYSGIAREPGEVAGPPDIEVYCLPVQGTANGKIVVDGAICIYPELGPLKETVTLEIKDGKIKDIKGGREALTFKRIFDDILLENPKTENLTEFAIGLNTSCFLTGNYFEDEGSGRTMHFGFGGSVVGEDYHIDFVLLKPNVLINGELIVKEGEVI